MKRRKNNKNLRALAITLVIVIVMGVFCLADNSLVSTAVNAVTKGLFQVTSAVAANLDTASYEDLKAENEKLKQENAELRNELVDYYNLKEENEKLWKYYDLKKENPSYQIQPANVIRRDSNDDFYSFTLDIGSANGVEVNCPVITDNGLVGWVSKTDATTCLVKTVLSPDTKAGAVDKQTKDSGIITGSASLCDKNLTQLTKITEDNKIKEGDIVVTSGAGGVYPDNLVVGKVKEIKFNSYDTTRYAVVEPYEDIKSISAAAVIIDFDGKGEVAK
ncbi:MAG: rod shape-determining protein MreC [Ruminococcus sp.]|nr:rod shape-determining protein MreC [Ruminococcus sp.]